MEVKTCSLCGLVIDSKETHLNVLASWQGEKVRVIFCTPCISKLEGMSTAGRMVLAELVKSCPTVEKLESAKL